MARNRKLALLPVGAVVVGTLLTGTTLARGPDLGSDVTADASLRARIVATAERFANDGGEGDPSRLKAVRFADGTIVISPKDMTIADDRLAGGGLRMSIAQDGEGGPKTASLAEGPVLAAASDWLEDGDNCWSTVRGVTEMYTCYQAWRKINDGSTTYDYKMLDLYATMFSGDTKTIDWGWIAADRDAGPALTYMSFSPPADDYKSSCINAGLGLSGPFAGVSYSSDWCELWDISKSAGTTLGYFKNQWSWGTRQPIVGRDRNVAFKLGVRHANAGGGVTWGLSWNYAYH